MNVLAPGDRILAFNYGHFSAHFASAARNLGYHIDEVPLRWGQALTGEEISAHLANDRGPNRYKAVLAVHNETLTGVASPIGAIQLRSAKQFAKPSNGH